MNAFNEWSRICCMPCNFVLQQAKGRQHLEQNTQRPADIIDVYILALTNMSALEVGVGHGQASAVK